MTQDNFENPESEEENPALPAEPCPPEPPYVPDYYDKLLTVILDYEAFVDPMLDEFANYIVKLPGIPYYYSKPTDIKGFLATPPDNAQTSRQNAAMDGLQKRYELRKAREFRNEFPSEVSRKLATQREKIDDIRNEVYNSIRALSGEINVTIEESVTNAITANMGELTQRIERLIDLLNQYYQRLEQQLFEIFQTLDRIDKTLDELDKKVHTLFQNVDDIKNTLKEIRREFDLVAKDLQNKLDALAQQIKDFVKKFDTFSTKFDNFSTKFDNFSTKFDNFAEITTTSLTNLKENLRDIKTTLQTLKQSLQNISNDLNTLDNKLEAIKNICAETLTQSKQNNIDIVNFQNTILPITRTINNRLLGFIETYSFRFHVEYIGLLGALQLGQDGIGEAISLMNGELVGLIFQQGEQTRLYVQSRSNGIEDKLLLIKELMQKNEKNAVERHDALVNKIDKFWENNKEVIVEDCTQEVCQSIVGQSYIKMDTTNAFFPTIVFKFCHLGNNSLKKQSQISVRFNVKSDDITPVIIQDLKTKLLLYKDLSYTSGNLHANFKLVYFRVSGPKVQFIFN